MWQDLVETLAQRRSKQAYSRFFLQPFCTTMCFQMRFQHRFSTVLWLIAQLWVTSICTLLPLHAQSSLEADTKQLAEWLTGEFDNFQQVWLEKEEKDKGKPVEMHEHIHSLFQRVNAPAFGSTVLYVKQYLDGDPRKIYRQRLYVLKPNPQENAVQLDIYSFAADSLFYDVPLNPQKVERLTPSAMTMTPGCAVYWKRSPDGSAFVGYMKDKACNFVSKRSGKKVFVTDSLRLTRDELWIRDEASDEQGNYVFGHKGKIHHKLKRCRIFTGFMVVKKDPPSDTLRREGKEEYITLRNISLHDQGGRVRCISETGEQTKYSVELSQVIYQTGLPVLKLAIYEEGNPKALAYTWANTDARRIGINLRYVQAGFSLPEEK
jgi:hypothetical protein